METLRQMKTQKLEEAERKKREEDLEREKTLFVRKDNVIRKNDMITDPVLKKIKLDPEHNSNPAVVKQEVESEEGRMLADNMEEGDFFVMKAPEVLTPEHLELEEGVEFVTVEEKVDLPKMDESCSSEPASLSSPENVTQTIEALQKENQKLKSQLKQKDLEKKILMEQRSQAEPELESVPGKNMKQLLLEKDKELASQTQTICSLRLQLEKMTELLAEKSAEVKSEAETSQSLRSQIANLQKLVDSEMYNDGKSVEKEDMKDGKGDQLSEENTIGHCISSEEKVTQHFQEVLTVFIRHQEKIRHWNLVNWTKMIPRLKMCRLVCKSWKESVDFILQNDSSHVSLFGIRNFGLRFEQKYIPLPLLFSTLNTKINNASSMNLQEFLQNSERMPPGYNPVPTRYIMISQDFSCLEDPSRWKIVSKYLQQFGKQVWYLTVNISLGGTLTSLELIIQRLCEMLELVPNIRSLAVRTRTWLHGKNDNSRLEQPSFPHLKNLETFSYSGHYDLFNCILATNQHIRRLEFFEYFIRNSAFTGETKTGDLAFENLSVSSSVKSDSWKKIINDCNAKFEKLHLIFYPSAKANLTDSGNDTMQGIQNLGRTLKFLILDLPHIQEAMLVSGKVNLPQLKHLHIHSRDWEPTNWERFLVQLESLESFSLDEIINTRPTVVQKRTFVEFVNSFQDKTDWVKMLKLNLVTLTVIIFHDRINHFVGEAVQVTEKRAKNDVLRFNLVKINEKEIDEIFL